MNSERDGTSPSPCPGSASASGFRNPRIPSPRIQLPARQAAVSAVRSLPRSDPRRGLQRAKPRPRAQARCHDSAHASDRTSSRAIRVSRGSRQHRDSVSAMARTSFRRGWHLPRRLISSGNAPGMCPNYPEQEVKVRCLSHIQTSCSRPSIADIIILWAICGRPS